MLMLKNVFLTMHNDRGCCNTATIIVETVHDIHHKKDLLKYAKYALFANSYNRTMP